jgi:hypothetical protein
MSESDRTSHLSGQVLPAFREARESEGCTGPDRRAGWVPEQFLRREGQGAVMLRGYPARELNGQAGAEVMLGDTISGWVWAIDADGRAGWIPETCLVPG